MTPPAPVLARAAALVALGALIVHHLRYAIVYGGDAGQALAAQGHGYLGQVLPALIALALATLAGCLVRGALKGPAGVSRGRIASTGVFAAAILCTFVAQESVEGLLFGGHPGGWAAVLGEGGWIAAPLALALGVCCALADTALGRLESALAVACARERRPRRAALRLRSPALVSLRRISPLASGLASRPPPGL